MAAVNPDDLDVVLRGKGQDVTLGNGLTSTDYELTIEGAPTVTMSVQDRARVLFSSGLLDVNDDGRLEYDLDATIDDVEYRLSLFEKQGDTMSLTFIDKTVSVLMHTYGQIKPRSRDHVAFAKRLVESVGGRFVTPTGVPVISTKDTTIATKAARKESDDRREPGIPDKASLMMRDAGGHTYKASQSQIRIAEKLISVAKEMDAGQKATLALVMAGIVESQLTNSSKIGDPGSTSVGVLQAQYGLSRGYNGTAITKEQAVDVAYTARSFLGRPTEANGGFASKGSATYLARKHPDWTAGQIAAEVEAPAAQYRGRYDQVRTEAAAFIAAYEGGSTDTSSGGGSAPNVSSGESPVQVGTPEDPHESYWAAMQRISQPRGYRCFALHNTIYYGREQDFIRSRARMVLSEQAPGVDWINGSWAPAVRINEASVVCRASLWAAPPGSVVIVEDTGPLNGRWLVVSFTRSRFSKSAEITMRRGTQLLKPEPVTEQSTGTAASKPSASPSSAAAPSNSKTGSVKADPGNGSYVSQTTRPDGRRVEPNKGLQAFLRLLAGAVGQTIYTNTYSRHPRLTTNNTLSDHWDGNAVDIHTTPPLDSPLGDRICFHALRLAGVSQNVAQSLADRGCNFPNYTWHYEGRRYNVQVGWRVEGHHDHVHVGVRPL